jgi:hypothetical protein
VTRYGRWRFALGVFAATALLEIAQVWIPGLWAYPIDVILAVVGGIRENFSQVGALNNVKILRGVFGPIQERYSDELDDFTHSHRVETLI